MNTEQDREAFEALERKRKGFGPDTLTLATIEPDDEYLLPLVQARWEGYQAGRAALQSQDREDASRWRHAFDADTEKFAICRLRVDGSETYWEPIENTIGIDHARRVEGEGE